MTVWSWLWIGWFLLFAVIEGSAILLHKWPGTLSDQTRELFHTRTRVGRYVWIFAAGCLFAWLLVHIAVAGSA